MGNVIGTVLRLTTFGESHGRAVGGILEGLPAGLEIDFGFVEQELKRRNPSSVPYATPRHEPDEVEFLSGIFEGKSLGMPIAFVVYNKEHAPEEYENLKNIFRASHADYGYWAKYGIRDYRGGGRASARETVSRVVGGALAKLLLRNSGISVLSYVVSLCGISCETRDYDYLEQSVLNIPDAATERKVMEKLKTVSAGKDSCGGVIETVCRNVPAGLGEPVFDKLEACLAKAVLSIPAVKGIEFGDGFGFAHLYGSNAYDEFVVKNGKVTTAQNHNGGIIGGISTGNEIIFRTVFKPVSTIPQKRKTVTVDNKETIYIPSGRHDVTFLPRATVIVESMTALVLADMLLRNRIAKLPDR